MPGMAAHRVAPRAEGQNVPGIIAPVRAAGPYMVRFGWGGSVTTHAGQTSHPGQERWVIRARDLLQHLAPG